MTMHLTRDQYQRDRRDMKAFIAQRIPEEGTRIILADGEGGEIWADLCPILDQEDGWDLYFETNCREAIGLPEIHDHFRQEEMTSKYLQLKKMTLEEWLAEARPDPPAISSRSRESVGPSGESRGERPPETGSPEFLTLVEAAKLLPGRRPGKRISVETLWRWCQRGIRNGLRLRSVLVGGQRCTTRQRVQNFIDAMNIAREGDASETTQPRTPGQRQSASQRAAEELEARWNRRRG